MMASVCRAGAASREPGLSTRRPGKGLRGATYGWVRPPGEKCSRENKKARTAQGSPRAFPLPLAGKRLECSDAYF